MMAIIFAVKPMAIMQIVELNTMNNIKYTTSDRVSGTSFMGYLPTTYDKLVELIGEPNYGLSGDGKVTCEWVLDIDGTVVTIYDWKCGSTPMGEYDWHVGGHSTKAVKALQEALNLPTIVWKY